MPLQWETSSILIAAFLAAGVVDDLRSRKIHNVLVLCVLAFSVLSLFLIPNFSTTLVQSGQSLGLALVLGLGLWYFNVWGGGDAKLFLAVSPLLIPGEVPIFLLGSLFWGAVMGLTLAIMNGRLLNMLTNMSNTLTHRQGPAERHLTKVPFSVALFFGHLTLMLLRQIGGQ